MRKLARKIGKLFHVHVYNIPYHPVHVSPDGQTKEIMRMILFKCRCGKCKR